MITIIYKTGKEDSQNGRAFKSRRKNAKDFAEEEETELYPQSSNEVNESCSFPLHNKSRVHSVDTKREIIRILHAKMKLKKC